VIGIVVPVIVNVAVRAAPVLAATVNWTLPVPMPDPPWVTVRKPWLLLAVHGHVEAVVTEMAAFPPEAPNVVVVCPVMIWHPPPPPGAVDELLEPQAIADTSHAAQKATRARREGWPDRYLFMSILVKT
jgi:hypothetical protein